MAVPASRTTTWRIWRSWPRPGAPVVFYDQLGCGKSDHPDDLALWIMDTFVEEIGAVRDALGLDRFHLLGHSWGG